VQLFISDKCLGLVESLAEFYPEARHQRCAVHFYRNVWSLVPAGKAREVAAMLKAIHASEDRKSARTKAARASAKLRGMKLPAAAQPAQTGIDETLNHYAFPSRHWRPLRTSNPLERLMREIRRRTRAVGAFPDGNSAMILVAARPRHVAGTQWGRKRHMDMSHTTAAAMEKQIQAA
jgi:transposase-like protein